MNSRHYPVLALLFLLFLFAFPGTRPAAADDGYTVQPGDNLYRIAQRHGLTVEELANANGISNPHRVYAGQVLVIPDEESGETESVAPETGTAPPTQEQVESIVARQEALTENTATEHVVQAGETLARIARRYGVTTSALIQMNDLAVPNLIFPGQRLQVPPSGAAVPAEAPAPPAGGYKQIVVDKSEQRAYVYQDGDLLWTFIISTGMPGSETWDGTFHVRSKIPNAYAELWSLQMPYWLGFYHTGYLENGFHALPIMASGAVLWDGYLGSPVSYGCVILSYPDAETLYNWAEIGTEVIVRP